MFMNMFTHKYPYTDFHELNLDFIVNNFKYIMDTLTSIDGWIDTHEEQYEQLKELYDMIEAGNLPDQVYETLKNWIINNFNDILGEMIKFVTFEINDQGYFVVNIPQSLSDLRFNTTGLDIVVSLQPEYGHLVLSY